MEKQKLNSICTLALRQACDGYLENAVMKGYCDEYWLNHAKDANDAYYQLMGCEIDSYRKFVDKQNERFVIR